MKDKLEKVGHKKSYYRFKGFLKSFAFVAILAVGCALPIAVAASASQQKPTAPVAVAVLSSDPDVSVSESEVSSFYSAD